MKKIKSLEKKAGIWLDQENAYIIWFKGGCRFTNTLPTGY